ncbi:unnamed protein product [Parascedosporium putredinis]|uniref:Uncharacterized protein n=1 Tax=Parascedosporium putredinis TaxID=1442378 RepID=A0A9P1GW22_9PEZI|nr:unnamed protein product [Parascedosporium putredinis]CAI7989051.1 unnamed protein product [Parascedosporium putredinis]
MAANHKLVSSLHRNGGDGQEDDDDDDGEDVDDLGADVDSEKGAAKKLNGMDVNGRDVSTGNGSDAQASDSRRDTGSGIWGSWRQGATNGSEAGQREGGPLSGYQPAGTRGRNMKVLKPLKSNSSSARTGASGEQRRKSQQGPSILTGSGDTGGSGIGSSGGSTIRWETKRAASIASSGDAKSPVTPLAQPGQQSRDARGSQTLPRSANPIGGASAFSWMKKPGTE